MAARPRASAAGSARHGSATAAVCCGATLSRRASGRSFTAASTTLPAVARNVVSFPPAVETRPRSSHTASSRDAAEGLSAWLESTGRTPANAPTTLRPVTRAAGKTVWTKRRR